MSIAVIGTSIIDHVIKTNEPMFNPYGCNKSDIKTTFGGSLRNIAENLAYLNQEVLFSTIIGNDILGELLVDHLIGLGVIVTPTIINQRSPSFTSIYTNNQVFRFSSVSPEFHFQTYEQIKIQHTNTCQFGITDIDNPNLLTTLFKKHKNIKWFLCASFLDDIKTYSTCFQMLYGIFLNKEEATYLGQGKSNRELADYLLSLGISKVIITLDKDGVYYKDLENEITLPSKHTTEQGFTIGCGDAFIAAMCFAMHNDFPIHACLEIGLNAAAIKFKTADVVTKEIAQILID